MKAYSKMGKMSKNCHHLMNHYYITVQITSRINSNFEQSKMLYLFLKNTMEHLFDTYIYINSISSYLKKLKIHLLLTFEHVSANLLTDKQYSTHSYIKRINREIIICCRTYKMNLLNVRFKLVFLCCVGFSYQQLISVQKDDVRLTITSNDDGLTLSLLHGTFE